MKKNYIAPEMRVVDIEVNDGMLQNTSASISNDPASDILGLEIKGEINFDNMKGTDIVRKNPWEDQW